MARTRAAVLIVGAALAALAPAAPAAAAQAGTCITVNPDAVQLIGAGAGGTEFSCDYVANGRGGISAATPNRWVMVNLDRNNLVVASSDGVVPVASTEDKVCLGDRIRVTMFQELQASAPSVVPGTYGAIRAGGAGVAPGTCSGT